MNDFYGQRHVQLDDCDALASAVISRMGESADFRVTQVSLAKNRGLERGVRGVMLRQRDAMINGFEPVGVTSSEVEQYLDGDLEGIVKWTDEAARVAHVREMDHNATSFLQDVGLQPSVLARIGLVVCGGCLVECALMDRPLTRADACDMMERTGFDVDMFITGDVPYRGSLEAYAAELQDHLKAHPDVRGVSVLRRGFCVDVFVTFVDGEEVKMQIVDLGVPASPMQIVSSFDITVAKMVYCPSTSRILMTEDAAYSLANGAIVFDRRYVEDPRYSQRLRKYSDRTGYGLVLDDLGRASARVVDHVRAVIAAAPPAIQLCETLCSWLEELPVSDTSVLAWSALGRIVGKGSCRGYGTKKRVADCTQLTGTCGRFGLRPVARRGDPVAELHSMFLLSKIARCFRMRGT